MPTIQALRQGLGAHWNWLQFVAISSASLAQRQGSGAHSSWLQSVASQAVATPYARPPATLAAVCALGEIAELAKDITPI